MLWTELYYLELLMWNFCNFLTCYGAGHKMLCWCNILDCVLQLIFFARCVGFSFQGKIDFSSYVQVHKRKQEAKTTITYIFKYLTLKKQRQKNSLLFGLDWQMPLAKKCIRIDSSFYTNHKKKPLFSGKKPCSAYQIW